MNVMIMAILRYIATAGAEGGDRSVTARCSACAGSVLGMEPCHPPAAAAACRGQQPPAPGCTSGVTQQNGCCGSAWALQQSGQPVYRGSSNASVSTLQLRCACRSLFRAG